MRLLIDGNNLAWRANVTTDLTTKQGERVSAIYGSLQMVQSYLKPSEGGYKNKLLDSLRILTGNKKASFSDVVFCWDMGKSKQRLSVYPEYKGQRDAKRESQTEEEKQNYLQFLDQMDQLHEILPKFGVRSLKIKGWEGDDLIYAITKLAPDDINVIVSTDRDMLQLVSEKVFVWSPFKEKLITPNNFTAEIGVPQNLYLSYRILVGDSSDNIPGIHGIGDKKAKALLENYGDINGIKKAQPLLMKSKVTSRIFENPDILERNDRLMNLSYVDFSEVEDDIREVLNKETKFDGKAVKAFLASKQFVKILSDFLMWSMVFRMLGEEQDD